MRNYVPGISLGKHAIKTEDSIAVHPAKMKPNHQAPTHLGSSGVIVMLIRKLSLCCLTKTEINLSILYNPMHNAKLNTSPLTHPCQLVQHPHISEESIHQQ